MFLTDVLNMNAAVDTSTVVTNKDYAEVNAVHHILPTANIFLCSFQCTKAFSEELWHHPVADHNKLISVHGVL